MGSHWWLPFNNPLKIRFYPILENKMNLSPFLINYRLGSYLRGELEFNNILRKEAGQNEIKHEKVLSGDNSFPGFI